MLLAVIFTAERNRTALADQTNIPASPALIRTCVIEATVLNIDASDQTGYYAVNLNIKSIAPHNQENDTGCNDENYAKQIEGAGQILSAQEFATNPIEKGDEINGIVSFNGDEHMAGYFLRDIQVIEKSNASDSLSGEQKQSTSPQEESVYPGYILFVITTIFTLALVGYSLGKKK
ncbi:MAG: hypothetical protein PHI66_03270 [Candidatus Pacebacteria bacterium]|nr:hypothetical protein [Candidatus Paceibacterota bacterium]